MLRLAASFAHACKLAMLISLSAGLLAACNQPERMGSQPAVDPRRSMPIAHYNDLTLNPMVLVTHADYDRWEQEVKARGGSQLVYTLYREAMLKQRGDQRTFVRWIIAALDPELDDQYRRGLQPFIRSLMKASELGADARYLFGALAWFQLRQDPLGADAPRSTLDRTLVDTIQTHWERLIRDNPTWRGPHGITAADLQGRLNAISQSIVPPTHTPTKQADQQTFGGLIAQRVDEAYAKAKRSPPWVKKAKEAQETLQGFYQEYEEHGPKRACQRVDQAMALVQDPTAIGDAYAHCALDRKNPFAAIDQVRRMVLARRIGGLGSVMHRLSRLAQSNAELLEELNGLQKLLFEIENNDAPYVAKSGLSGWTKRATSP